VTHGSRCEQAGAVAVIIGNNQGGKGDLFAAAAPPAAAPIGIPVVVVCSDTLQQLQGRLHLGAVYATIAPQVRAARHKPEARPGSA